MRLNCILRTVRRLPWKKSPPHIRPRIKRMLACHRFDGLAIIGVQILRHRNLNDAVLIPLLPRPLDAAARLGEGERDAVFDVRPALRLGAGARAGTAGGAGLGAEELLENIAESARANIKVFHGDVGSGLPRPPAGPAAGAALLSSAELL